MRRGFAFQWVEALTPRGRPQRAQWTLIKEYTFNSRGRNINCDLRYDIYSLIKGYWALWDPPITIFFARSI